MRFLPRQTQHSKVPSGLLMLAVLSLLILGGLSRSHAAEEVKVDVAVDPARSVFMDELSFGKDPFYPESVRRVYVPPAPETNSAPVVVRAPQPNELFELLTIKGISSAGRQPLVMINRYTLGEGDEQVVKKDGRQFKIRCAGIDVRKRSTLIVIEGQTNELVYRDSLEKTTKGKEN